METIDCRRTDQIREIVEDIPKHENLVQVEVVRETTSRIKLVGFTCIHSYYFVIDNDHKELRIHDSENTTVDGQGYYVS